MADAVNTTTNTAPTVSALNTKILNVLGGGYDFGGNGQPLPPVQAQQIYDVFHPQIYDLKDSNGNPTGTYVTTRTVKNQDGSTSVVNEPVDPDAVVRQMQTLLGSTDPNVRALATQFFVSTDYTGKDGSVKFPVNDPKAFAALQTLTSQQNTVRSTLAQTPGALEDALNKSREAKTRLGPEGNPYLTTFASGARDLANGTTADASGRQGAESAAAGIGTAGQAHLNQATDAYGRTLGQAGQMAKDIGIVRNTALGNGPSAAAVLGNKLIDDQQRAIAAQAATARGGNLAAAQRNAMNAGQNAELQGQQQILAARANEQLAAQGLLGTQNAALGTLYNGAGAGLGALATTDINRQGAMAAGLGNVYGTTGQLAANGVAQLGNATQQFGNLAASQESAERGGRQDILGTAANLAGSSLGAGASLAGTGVQQNLGQQNIDFNKDKFEYDKNQWWKPLAGAVIGGASDLGAAAIK
jgi:hypothetical protein